MVLKAQHKNVFDGQFITTKSFFSLHLLKLLSLIHLQHYFLFIQSFTYRQYRFRFQHRHNVVKLEVETQWDPGSKFGDL